MTRIFSLLGAVVLCLSTAATASASTLDFRFAFNFEALIVEGTVFGLEDNTIG